MHPLIARSAYFAVLVVLVAMGRWDDLAFYGAVFLVTLPLTHPRLRSADAAISTLFTLAAILGLTGLALTQTIIGLDKLFHALGGAAAALILWTLLKGHLPRPWLLSALILFTGAVAIGAWWEVFEWAYFSLLRPEALTSITYADTMLDLVADTLGAGAGALVLARK